MEKKLENKIRGKDSVLLRMMIVLFIGTGFKLFFSCTPHYSSTPIKIIYNSIRVAGVDNITETIKAPKHAFSRFELDVGFSIK